MKRKYELKRRAERRAETRGRIVRAAVGLHSTVGPSATSIAAIAREAGVQRHTVYAHFPDDGTLFRACSAHWGEEHPFPNAASLPLGDALEAVYDWYEDVEGAFALFLRDSALYPDVWAKREAQLAALADDLAAPYGGRRAVRAATGHAVAFETWRSLVRREGLSNGQAAAAMVALVEGVAATGASRRPTTSHGGRTRR
jgi:AcrR family transcriptional regulator